MPAPISLQAALLEELRAAHGILESTVADVDDELANRPAPGKANSVGSAYAHVLFYEDHSVNRWLSGRQPLFATAWAGRTGTDRVMPFHAGGGDLGEWYRSVQVNMAALREYAKAVYENSEAFLRDADEETLAREMETPMGVMPLSVMFSVFVTGHCNNLTGEISAVKGVFGRTGYGF